MTKVMITIYQTCNLSLRSWKFNLSLRSWKFEGLAMSTASGRNLYLHYIPKFNNQMAREIVRHRADAEVATLAVAFEMARSGRFADLRHIKTELVKAGHCTVDTALRRHNDRKALRALCAAHRAGQHEGLASPFTG